MNIDRESAISAFTDALERERSRSHFMNPGIALYEDGTVTYASSLNLDDDVVKFDDWENGDGWGIEGYIPEMTDDEICKAAEACAELYEDSLKYFEPEEEEEED
jgi:hypothetical protein